MTFLEDIALVKILKRKGHIRLANQYVITSGRRWQKLGVAKTTFLNQLIISAYLLGFSPRRLKGLYMLGKKG